jgi:hypothetical protein
MNQILKIKFKISLFLSAFFLLNRGVSLAEFTEITDESTVANTNIAESNFLENSFGIITVLLALVFIFSLIGFLIAGVKYIIAGGSEATLEDAKKIWVSSLVGVSVSLLGYVILNLIKYLS